MIGKNIQVIRKKRGLTLSQLAEQANVSKSYLSNIERSINQNPSIQIMEKIASVLEVDFRILLGIDKVKPPCPEEEWHTFFQELSDEGIGTDQLKEYKLVIEFVRWKNKRLKNECNDK